jgi:hypothetical protein
VSDGLLLWRVGGDGKVVSIAEGCYIYMYIMISKGKAISMKSEKSEQRLERRLGYAHVFMTMCARSKEKTCIVIRKECLGMRVFS